MDPNKALVMHVDEANWYKVNPSLGFIRIVGVLIKKPEDNASGKMYIILNLLSSSNWHHNPLWT